MFFWIQVSLSGRHFKRMWVKDERRCFSNMHQTFNFHLNFSSRTKYGSTCTRRNRAKWEGEKSATAWLQWRDGSTIRDIQKSCWFTSLKKRLKLVVSLIFDQMKDWKLMIGENPRNEMKSFFFKKIRSNIFYHLGKVFLKKQVTLRSKLSEKTEYVCISHPWVDLWLAHTFHFSLSHFFPVLWLCHCDCNWFKSFIHSLPLQLLSAVDPNLR